MTSIHVFDELLQGFQQRLDRLVAGSSSEAFSELIQGFSECVRQNSKAEFAVHQLDIAKFKNVTEEYVKVNSVWKDHQRTVASQFSILDVLHLTFDEVRHSMVLAWLLDADLDHHGTHGQGNLGFDLFLQELKLPRSYCDADYWVTREVEGEESRIDIEIGARTRFLIHIENKIWSKEGQLQTNREWADVCKRAKALEVPLERVHCIYLSPAGTLPAHEKFTALSWSRVRTILEKFSAKAQPPEVKLFAKHYAHSLTLAAISEKHNEELENEQHIYRSTEVPS